jgi:hypothetical protein
MTRTFFTEKEEIKLKRDIDVSYANDVPEEAKEEIMRTLIMVSKIVNPISTAFAMYVNSVQRVVKVSPQIHNSPTKRHRFFVYVGVNV